MDHPDHNAPPLNPIPPVVWLMVLPVVAVELIFGAGARGLAGGAEAIGWRLQAVRDWGFFVPGFDWMVENRQMPADLAVRFVSHAFVHANFTHALFAAVFLLALGKFVAEVFRPLAVLAVFLGGIVAGALAYGLLLSTNQPLLGAYSGAYGLIGAFTFILWTRLGQVHEDRARAFLFIGFLMGLQLLFNLINLILLGGVSWHFVADLAGFAAGFGLSFLVAPGGWAALLRRLRQG